MSSTDVGRTLLIMLCINSLFFLAQLGMNEANPGSANTLINIGNSPIEQYNSNNNYQLSENGTSTVIPEGIASNNPNFGFTLTDAFSVLKDWITGNYLWMFLWAIPNFITAIGLPAAVSFTIGSLWVIYGTFIMVSWMLGRQN